MQWRIRSKVGTGKNMPSDKINLTHFQSKSGRTARKQPLSRALHVSPVRLRMQGKMHSVSFSDESINWEFIRSWLHGSGPPNQRFYQIIRSKWVAKIKDFIRSSGEVGQQIRESIRSSYLMLRRHIYCSTHRQKPLHNQRPVSITPHSIVVTGVPRSGKLANPLYFHPPPVFYSSPLTLISCRPIRSACQKKYTAACSC